MSITQHMQQVNVPVCLLLLPFYSILYKQLLTSNLYTFHLRHDPSVQFQNNLTKKKVNCLISLFTSKELLFNGYYTQEVEK